MRLSDRLESIIELVPEGRVCADIGCDHGFISIELVSRGISPYVYAADLRPGPLETARENIRNAGLEDRIKTVLSDGFDLLKPGDIQTAVIAGMGGVLMTEILGRASEHTAFMDGGFVVQPQSNIQEFRQFLRSNGYEIMENRIVRDAGKYYFPMKIRACSAAVESADTEAGGMSIELSDRYGEDLLREDRGLSEYLEYEMDSLKKIKEKLLSEEGSHEDRISEIDHLMELNRTAFLGLNRN
jgi:tRNA (adenine22-N1)-methyltransferase